MPKKAKKVKGSRKETSNRKQWKLYQAVLEETDNQPLNVDVEVITLENEATDSYDTTISVTVL